MSTIFKQWRVSEGFKAYDQWGYVTFKKAQASSNVNLKKKMRAREETSKVAEHFLTKRQAAFSALGISLPRCEPWH